MVSMRPDRHGNFKASRGEATVMEMSEMLDSDTDGLHVDGPVQAVIKL